MVEDVEYRLAAAADALRKYELTAQRGMHLQRRMAELGAQLDSLRVGLAAEHADVRRLEGLSLARLLAWLQGAQDDQLARERAEADAAYYGVRVTEAYLETVRREYEAVHARLAQLAYAPAIYAAALDEKEGRLQESGDPRRGLLLELADERGLLAGELHEIREALREATTAQEALDQVRERLGNASTWSISSDWFRDPVSATVVDSRLEQVAAAAAYADRCLAGLRIELADVSSAMPPALWQAVGGTTRFFDLWLDNAFTRLSAGMQVAWVQRNVDESARVVTDVYGRLAQRAAEVRARLDRIEAERRTLLA